jgi:hypothetical protein
VPGGEFSALAEGACYDFDVALRPKSVAIAPALTRAGRKTWRITGTIDGKQRQIHRMCREDAEAIRDAWEAERLSAAAALRPKITRLTKAELEEAEACLNMLTNSGFTLRDAVLAFLRNPPPKRCELTFVEAYEKFLMERAKVVTETHIANYRSPFRRFAEFLGPETKLDQVTSERITAWLESLKGISPKSWNNYRNDLGCLFNWFRREPQCWVSKNPVDAVRRYRKRQTLPKPAAAIPVQRVEAMMAWIEENYPHWVTFFALAVFAGVRPDRDDGEFFKLSEAIREDGVEKYFISGGRLLRLTPQITKDGRQRTIQLSANLTQWLERYPVTPQSLLGGTRAEYAAIRAKWKIPHDGLRHTSVSACTALHGITQSVVWHGHSERVCKDHYLDLYTKEDATAFYSILPKRPGVSPSETAA